MTVNYISLQKLRTIDRLIIIYNVKAKRINVYNNQKIYDFLKTLAINLA